jgi:hypothetical protein
VVLACITAHAMGANSISLTLLPWKDGLCLVTSSGGDDQSLSITITVVEIQQRMKFEMLVAIIAKLVFCKQGAGGAALKGSLILCSDLIGDDLSLVLASVAYDQRLCVWNLKASLTGATSENAHFQLVPLVFHELGASKKLSAGNLHYDNLFAQNVVDGGATMVQQLDCSLSWLKGLMTHVMEVGHLCAATQPKPVDGSQMTTVLSVAGQGVETFSFQM